MMAKHPTIQAEDAIDRLVDDATQNPALSLRYLRHIAAYAMARFDDVWQDARLGTADYIDYATIDSVPPISDRTRRRRARDRRTPPT